MNKNTPPSALTRLKERIEKAKNSGPVSPRVSDPKPLAKLANVGVELVAGIITGVAIGLFIDWVFNISPWGLIISFTLGSAAGFLNVYRTLTQKKP